MPAHVMTDLAAAPLRLPARPAGAEQGAECLFRGTTRGEDHPEHGPLIALEYEVHEAMARTLLEELAREIGEEFDVVSVRILHAVGRVEVGEDSVLVEARAAHRDDAFRACRAAIDRLKERLPVFKIECWRNGRTRPPGVRPGASNED